MTAPAQEPGPRRWSPRNEDGSVRWSWHVIESYLQCPRKYEMAVVRDLVTTDYRRPLALGSAVHAGLAAAFRRLQRAQERAGGAFSLTRGQREILETAAIAAVEADPGVTTDDRLEALRLVRAYCQGGLYETEAGVEDFDRWLVLNVETMVHADLRILIGGKRRVLWCQTPDLIVSVDDGLHDGLWVVDHKTTSRLGSTSLAKYYIDGQALALVATLRAAGIPVRGFVPNLIVKTKTIQFAHEYIEFDDYLPSEFAREIAYWQRSVQARLRRNGPWPRNYHSCVGQYGFCDYYERCRLGDAAPGFVPRSTLALDAAAAELDAPIALAD